MKAINVSAKASIEAVGARSLEAWNASFQASSSSSIALGNCFLATSYMGPEM